MARRYNTSKYGGYFMVFGAQATLTKEALEEVNKKKALDKVQGERFVRARDKVAELRKKLPNMGPSRSESASLDADIHDITAHGIDAYAELSRNIDERTDMLDSLLEVFRKLVMSEEYNTAGLIDPATSELYRRGTELLKAIQDASNRLAEAYQRGTELVQRAATRFEGLLQPSQI